MKPRMEGHERAWSLVPGKIWEYQQDSHLRFSGVRGGGKTSPCGTSASFSRQLLRGRAALVIARCALAIEFELQFVLGVLQIYEAPSDFNSHVCDPQNYLYNI